MRLDEEHVNLSHLQGLLMFLDRCEAGGIGTGPLDKHAHADHITPLYNNPIFLLTSPSIPPPSPPPPDPSSPTYTKGNRQHTDVSSM